MKIPEAMKLVPSYVQVAFTVGGLVFGGGILYADVQDIKTSQAKTEVVLGQYSQTVSQVASLEVGLAAANKTNERVVTALDKLAGTVELLSINVARLEERTARGK